MKFSTDDVPPPERVRRWQQIMSDLMGPLDCRPNGRKTFDGNVVTLKLGDMQCNQIASGAVNAYRTPRHIAQTDDDFLTMAFVTQGSVRLLQDGRETLVDAGEFSYCDHARPFEVRSGPVTHTIFRIPRNRIGSRVLGLEKFTATKFTRERPLDHLTFQFWTSVSRIADHVDEQIRVQLCEQALDLFAMTLAERQANLLVSASTHRSAMLWRLKAHIRGRLRDPDLCLSQVASELRISPRYVNNLLAVEQTSFMRHVLSQRLERCRQDLCNGALLHRQVGEIAFSWGFNDLSHFSRQFKERYGFSPREYRHLSRQGDGLPPVRDQ